MKSVKDFQTEIRRILADGKPRTMRELADLVGNGWLEPELNPHLKEAVWFTCRPDNEWRWSLDPGVSQVGESEKEQWRPIGETKWRDGTPPSHAEMYQVRTQVGESER